MNSDSTQVFGETMSKRQSLIVWSTMALLIAIFAVGIDELIISPLLIDVSNTLHSSLNITVLGVSIYGFISAISAPLITPIGDRVKRLSVIIVAIVIFIAGTVLCALANNIPTFLVARALSGLGAGALVPSVYAYVGDTIPFDKRGKVMGVIMSGWAAALVLGVPVGGWIGGQFGWRTTFVLIAMLAIISLCFLLRLSQSSRTQSGPVNRANQMRITRVFQIPGVLVLIIVTFCNMFGFYGTYTYLGSFLRSSYHLGSAQASGFILLYGIGIMLSPISGHFADRFGKYRSLFIALIILAVVLNALPYSKSVLFLITMLFIWGIGQSIVLTTLSTLLTETSQDHRGQIMGLYSLATNMAVVLGSSMLGSIYTKYSFALVGLFSGVVTMIGAVILMVFYIRSQGNTQSMSSI